MTAYTVAMAGLLLLGGRIADVAGAAPMFRLALLGFAVTSAACAAAPSSTALIAARIAQGAAAALLSPSALAVLQDLTRDDGAARRRAWAGGRPRRPAAARAAGCWAACCWSSPGGGGRSRSTCRSGCSPCWWRSGAAVGQRPGTTEDRGLDASGAAVVTVAIAAAVLGLSTVAERPAGWLGWALLVGAALLSAVFVRHERRTARPLLPGHLVAQPGVRGGNLTAAALTACTSPAMLTVVWYVQGQLRLAARPRRAPVPRVQRRGGGRSAGRAPAAVEVGHPHPAAGRLRRRHGRHALLLTLPDHGLPDHGLPLVTLLGSFALTGGGLGVASTGLDRGRNGRRRPPTTRAWPAGCWPPARSSARRSAWPSPRRWSSGR